MPLKCYIVDAFAEHIFEGNPTAVFLLNAWLDESLMHAIAKENHLSATAYLLSEETGWRIRSFTPAGEIDYCDHATLASAYVIHRFVEPSVTNIAFQAQSGILRVICDKEVLTLDCPSLPPLSTDQNISELSLILGAPIFSLYESGVLMAELENEKIVRELTPDVSALKAFCLTQGVRGIIVTARGSDCDFVSRCFYPAQGIDEEPVSASAHCHLIPYWACVLGKSELVAKQLSQRGGTLYCKDTPRRVFISGKAALYAQSTIYL